MAVTITSVAVIPSRQIRGTMRRAIGLSLVLMIGCVAGAAVRDIVVPARAQGQTGPNYEYQVVHLTERMDENQVLAQFGSQGWRLAAIKFVDNYNNNFYFERQLPR